jgi:hypothetical protein
MTRIRARVCQKQIAEIEISQFYGFYPHLNPLPSRERNLYEIMRKTIIKMGRGRGQEGSLYAQIG